MDVDDVTPVEAGREDAPEPAAEPTIEQVCESIWRGTEDVLELLRSYSTGQIQLQKSPDVLWVDDVTRAQGNIVISIRQLCVDSPEGVTLKKIAETIGVSAAAASVMVDLLVTKKMLRRTRSKSDRRALLIRLTPQTSRLFEISERSLGEALKGVADELGPDILHQWEAILVAASAVLRRTVGARTVTESESGSDEEPLEEGQA